MTWRRRLRRGAGALCGLGAAVVWGDPFHYQNFLIGDRAIGLGGAYVAVSDDASSIFYNPAGAAFALSNDISGSANVMYQRRVTYRNTIAGEDFVEKSSGTVPSFFGGLIKLDSVLPGLSVSWGLYSLDSNLKDQDDLYQDKVLGYGACPQFADTVVPTRLNRFHRTVNARESSDFVGASLAYRLSNRVGIGLAFAYVSIAELVQEYQDVNQTYVRCPREGSAESGPQIERLQLTQNIRQNLLAYGIQPTLGVQVAATTRLSLGANLKFGSLLSQRFDQVLEVRRLSFPEISASRSSEAIAGAGGYFPTLAQVSVAQSPGTVAESDHPLGALPSSVRVGAAYFASTRLLLAADVERFGAVSRGEALGGRNVYGRQAVTNGMVGAEYYVTPSLPVRIGAFTNNDARPRLQAGLTDQRDRIDYQGASLFLAWVQPNSQLGGGIVIQRGEGKAQKIGGTTAQQDVAARSLSFAFSATTAL